MKNIKYSLTILLSLFLFQIHAQTFVTPNVCMTETFTVNNGEVFTDPTDGVQGGPGGNCDSTSSGDPGDYPDAGCVTTTTLCSANGMPITLDFTSFGMFATFDWIQIFDGTTGTGTPKYDNLNGPADNFLSDFVATNGSSMVTCPSGCITVVFNTSTVVNQCGWEATISIGGSPPEPDCDADNGTVILTTTGN